MARRGWRRWRLDAETGEMKGFITKFFTVDQLIAITERLAAKPGDLLLFASDAKSALLLASWARCATKWARGWV
jgi:aspartyl-tRNA synthetase